MAALEIASGHDPQQLVTLLECDAGRWCDQPDEFVWGGVAYAPADFTATQTNDGYSCLEIRVSASRHMNLSGKCRVRVVGGSDTLYDAQNLDLISYDSAPGTYEARLGYQAAISEPSIRYTIDRYHGLRRYQDPKVSPEQVTVLSSAPVAPVVQSSGPNIRNAVSNLRVNARKAVSDRVGVAALTLLGRVLGRKRTIPGVSEYPAMPISVDIPERKNVATIGRLLPDRYGRTLFTPEIAHPTYSTASGSTVTENLALCLGLGGYAIHNIWVEGILAWSNGTDTGAIAGFTVDVKQPGESLSLPYISLVRGLLDTDWRALPNQTGYSADNAGNVTLLDSNWGTGLSTTPTVLDTFVSRDVTGITSPFGVVRERNGAVSTLAGLVTSTSAVNVQLYATYSDACFTNIQHSAVHVTAKGGSAGSNSKLIAGTLNDTPVIPDLTSTSVAVGTSYSVSTFAKQSYGPTVLMFCGLNPSTSVGGFMCDLSIEPNYAPPVGAPEASHMEISYTYQAAPLGATITVEATRLYNGAPTGYASVAALALATDKFGASAIDSASFAIADASCGGIFESGETQWDILTDLVSTASCRPVWRGGKLQIAQAGQQDPRLLLTPRSIISATVTAVASPVVADSVSVTYVEATTGNTMSQLYAPSGSPLANTASIESVSCPDAQTAMLMAINNYAALPKTGMIATVEIAAEGYQLAPLDRVLLALPDNGLGIGRGLLLAGDDWTTAAPAGATACVVYVRNPDGSPNGPISAMLGGDGQIYSAASTPAVTIPDHGVEWAAWAQSPQPGVISDMQQSRNGIWTITVVLG